ncbi:MAG: DEAD/DEAH box helicase family protein [Ignavibacteria bacterium]
MSHFIENYQFVKYPIEDGEEPGLRKAQLGAIHSISSHFTLNKAPALITMPTGSGKTVVLILTPYILRVHRVLVFTRNKLVRTQIYDEFKNLKKLKEIKVFEDDDIKPNIKEIKNKIQIDEEWNELRNFDVIIATPNSISPEYEDIPQPPQDLFDLVLIDEAHHFPAKTWQSIAASFPNAKIVLFTATPFRRDKKEIKAKYIFTYPIKNAIEDKIFGEVKFYPVTTNIREEPDISIAKKTENLFLIDKQNGFKHFIVVRTDSKKKANELKIIYENNTSLNLELIHSDHSYKRILDSIEKLKTGALDGIICVDMLGEGFDFPNLKIAAIHSPHKSLEVTLQFIGRFARTTSSEIGEAKFVAIPQDIKSEIGKLYKESSEWQNIIVELGTERILREETIRETLDKFNTPDSLYFKTDELSLYGINVYHHVKVYQVNEDFDLSLDIELDDQLEVIYKNYSSDLNSVIYVTREILLPKWTENEIFSSSNYDLFIIFFDQQNRLLYINSTRKTDKIYQNIIDQFNISNYKPLPIHIVDRVLHDLENQNFFNIGMRNKILNSNTESYRIMASKNAENAIDPTIGNLFDRGHIFCKATDDGEDITIGYSSKSKIWSNMVSQIPTFIEWCKTISTKLINSSEVITQTRIDFLKAPEKLTHIPEGIIAAIWNDKVFKNPINIQYIDNDGVNKSALLAELDINIVQNETLNNIITFEINCDNFNSKYIFNLDSTPYFLETNSNTDRITIISEREEIDFITFINNNPISFFTSDFSRITNEEISRYDSDNIIFDTEQIIPFDWDQKNVDITAEFGDLNNGKISIHNFLKSYLNSNDYDVVFYDHRSGEIADFVNIKEDNNSIIISLIHCKASQGANPGNRVGDVYEVTGQIVKSLKWLSFDLLLNKINNRNSGGSEFIKGDINLVRTILNNKSKTVSYKMIIVQPGISKSIIEDTLKNPLASANKFIKYGKCENLIVWASN